MPFCPKCKSNNTYQDGYDYACMMCGSRWPIYGGLLQRNDAKPAGMDLEKQEEKNMAIRKPCRNCGRTLCIAQDHLCGGCFGAVKKYAKGTQEYDAALAAAKKRFTDPGFKTHPGKRKKANIHAVEKVISKETEIKAADVELEVDPVSLLVATRNRLQNYIYKLNQAIEILS